MSNILSSYAGYLNPVDYGAIGNDAFINTTAFQNCFNDAYDDRKVVFIPRGVYRIDGTVDAKAPFYGTSGFMDRESRTSLEWNTIIKNDSINDGSAMFRIDRPTFNDLAPGMWIKDIKFDGNELNTIGIQGRDDNWDEENVLHNYYLYRVYAEQCTIGLDFYGFLGFFNDCYCKRNTEVGLRMTRNNAGMITGGEYAGMQAGQTGYGVEPLPWSVQIIASGPEPVTPNGGSTKGAGVISIDGATIEANKMNNGLLVTEHFNHVALNNLYMEGYHGGFTTAAHVMSIGMVNRWNTGTATNNLTDAVTNVVLDNVKCGNGAGISREAAITYDNPTPRFPYIGGIVEFGNILNMNVNNIDVSNRKTIFNSNCRFFSHPLVGGSARGNLTGSNVGYGSNMAVVDKTNTAGTEGTNFIVNPNSKGGFRGYKSVVHGGALLSAEDTTITRDGISSIKITLPNGQSTANSINLVPYGQEILIKGGLMVASAWIYIPNLAQYADDSNVPEFGAYYVDNTGTHTANYYSWSAAVSPGPEVLYSVIGEWNFAHVFMDVPTSGAVTEVGIKMLPYRNAPNPTADHYVYISDIRLILNGGSTDNIFKGLPPLNPSAGVLVGDAIHIQYFEFPTDPDVQWLQGDIIWNPNVVTGGNLGWVCVIDGPGGTVNQFKGFGGVT